HEVAILSIAFSFWPTQIGSISQWELDKKLSKENFTDVGIALGIATLLEKDLLIAREVIEESPDGDSYNSRHYQITPRGIAWMRDHKDHVVIKRDPRRPQATVAAWDDDIPCSRANLTAHLRRHRFAARLNCSVRRH